MRNITFIILAFFVFISVKAEELPYSELTNKKAQELVAEGFTFNTYTNCWKKKRRGAKSPKSKAYEIVLQNGRDKNGELGIAQVIVTFYNDKTYHKLMTYIEKNVKNKIYTSEGITEISDFEQDNYKCTLTKRRINRTYVTEGILVDDVRDYPYNIYEFTINTDLTPVSEYLEKEQKKKEKELKRNEKSSLNDYM
ncbi:MAG: hypothetical protein ACRDD8_08465 [Bacteroidales bacterium]